MDHELRNCIETVSAEMYERCHANAPNYGVDRERFVASVTRSADKFIAADPGSASSVAELTDFLGSMQADDLFLAMACAGGNERAWWEFDQEHRAYMERVARHLAKTEIDAVEIVDQVYVELYGTRVVDGERVSKFATYSGRGSIRGWLRTVIWHSLVDQHRAGADEVSLDEMTENIGEGAAHATFAAPQDDGESSMIDEIARRRYSSATVASLAAALRTLDAHERLLLMYYHVDGLKLREIAHLAGDESSPLRGWFQRQSKTRESGARVHESTVMRWLEKSYAKILERFRLELTGTHGLIDDEIEICLGLATEDLAGGNIYRDLTADI